MGGQAIGSRYFSVSAGHTASGRFSRKSPDWAAAGDTENNLRVRLEQRFGDLNAVVHEDRRVHGGIIAMNGAQTVGMEDRVPLLSADTVDAAFPYFVGSPDCGQTFPDEGGARALGALRRGV
jgi:hypothetical protein